MPIASSGTALPQGNHGPGIITSPSVTLPVGVTEVVFTMLLQQSQLETPVVLLNDLGVDWFNPASQAWEPLMRSGQFIGGVYLLKDGTENLQPKFASAFTSDVQGQKIRAFVDLALQLNIGFLYELHSS